MTHILLHTTSAPRSVEHSVVDSFELWIHYLIRNKSDTKSLMKEVYMLIQQSNLAHRTHSQESLMHGIKGIVQPKPKCRPLFTEPSAIPNPYHFLSFFCKPKKELIGKIFLELLNSKKDNREHKCIIFRACNFHSSWSPLTFIWKTADSTFC